MFNQFQSIKELLIEARIKIANEILGVKLQEYDFLFISNNITDYQNRIISKNIIDSRIIAIDHCNEENFYFIVAFNKTILIIIKSQMTALFQLLYSIKELNSKIEFYFLQDTKKFLTMIYHS